MSSSSTRAPTVYVGERGARRGRQLAFLPLNAAKDSLLLLPVTTPRALAAAVLRLGLSSPPRLLPVGSGAADTLAARVAAATDSCTSAVVLVDDTRGAAGLPALADGSDLARAVDALAAAAAAEDEEERGVAYLSLAPSTRFLLGQPPPGLPPPGLPPGRLRSLVESEYAPAALAAAASSLHAACWRLPALALAAAGREGGGGGGGGAAGARRRADAAWAAADLALALALDLALGAVLARALGGGRGRGGGLAASALDALADALLPPGLSPALDAMAGAPAPDAGAGAFADRLARAVRGALALHARVARGAVLPAARALLAAGLAGGRALGASFALAAAADAVDAVACHVHAAARALGRAYAGAGQLLLALTRLFRGRKRNALRRRVDTADGVPADRLVLGTLLFVPLFLLLPALAAHYALFGAARAALLAARAAAWAARAAAAPGGAPPLARLAAAALWPAALPPAGVALERAGSLRLTDGGAGGGAGAGAGAEARSGAGAGAGTGAGAGAGAGAGVVTVPLFCARALPPSASLLLRPGLARVWAAAAAAAPPREVLLRLLAGA